MSAHAPTKTYSRAVAANLEFQRQLGVRQNSLENKRRHSRCDLNTQIMTLRETLFNIRARTPTVLTDESEFGGAANSSGDSGRGQSLNGTTSSSSYETSGRSSSSKTSITPGATPILVRRDTEESMVPSTNGLVATNSDALARSNELRQPPRIVQVSVGASMPRATREQHTPSKVKQKIDVRLIPKMGEAKNQNVPKSKEAGDTICSVKMKKNQGPRNSITSHRRVIFSAHPSKRSVNFLGAKPACSNGTERDEEDTSTNKEENLTTFTMLRLLSQRRPATAHDSVSLSRHQNNMEKITYTSLAKEGASGVPRSEEHKADNGTSNTDNTPFSSFHSADGKVQATRSVHLVAGDHPSTKGKPSVDSPTFNREAMFSNVKPPVNRNPKTTNGFFLVRNPFFKLDPATEKRLEQVETIRVSLDGIYDKRKEQLECASAQEKAKATGEAESQAEASLFAVPESNDNNIAKRSEEQNVQPSVDQTNISSGRTDGVFNSAQMLITPKPDSLKPDVPKPDSVKPDSLIKSLSLKPSSRPGTAGVTVRVKMSRKKTKKTKKGSSRYSVHLPQSGPLHIPGVSSSQLRDLEKFHLEMTRKLAAIS